MVPSNRSDDRAATSVRNGTPTDTARRARAASGSGGGSGSADAQGDVRLFRQAAAVVFHQLRTGQGWSYREFGERVGLAHTALYVVERGDQTPSVETLSLVARACGVSFLDILGRITAQILVQAVAESSPAGDASGAGSVDLLHRVLALTPTQQRELAAFADWLIWRDGASAPT